MSEKSNQSINEAVEAAVADAAAEIDSLREKLARLEVEKGDAEVKAAIALHAVQSLNASANASSATEFPRVTIAIAEAASDTDPIDAVVGVNGRTYKIKRGVEASVPPEVVEVLENAVAARVVMKGEGVYEFKPVKRFPFRVVDQESIRNYDAWKDFHERARQPAAA